MSGRRRSLVVFLVLVCLLSVVPPSAGNAGNPGRLTTGWIPMDSSRSDAPADGMVDPRSPASTPGIDAASVRNLHEQGVTGDGVRVGVIGSSFDSRHHAIDDQVGDYRQFSGDGRLLANGAAHDTGVAEIVATTAPDSSLYLAGVGSRATPQSYRAAVEWLVANDVDVIVDSASYFPPDAASMEEMNAVATNASDSGVVFVTSAGNYANRHWSGTVAAHGTAPDATVSRQTGMPSWVAFENGTRYNRLGDGTISGHTPLRLYWSGDANLDLYVYRNTPGQNDPVVAKSVTEQTGTGDHAESIDVRLPEGNYYVAVRAERMNESVSVDLFSANHDLAVTSANGSMVAPATAERVISVGASSLSGRPRAYSSGGALLDLSAPDGTQTQAAGKLYGSSASAPVVAGTAALMVSQNGALTPAQTERILKDTATASDTGLEMNAQRAVAAAADEPAVRPMPDGAPTRTVKREFVVSGCDPAQSVGIPDATHCTASRTHTNGSD